jgi:hypothetical protein
MAPFADPSDLNREMASLEALVSGSRQRVPQPQPQQQAAPGASGLARSVLGGRPGSADESGSGSGSSSARGGSGGRPHANRIVLRAMQEKQGRGLLSQWAARLLVLRLADVARDEEGYPAPAPPGFASASMEESGGAGGPELRRSMSSSNFGGGGGGGGGGGAAGLLSPRGSTSTSFEDDDDEVIVSPGGGGGGPGAAAGAGGKALGAGPYGLLPDMERGAVLKGMIGEPPPAAVAFPCCLLLAHLPPLLPAQSTTVTSGSLTRVRCRRR